MKKRDCRWQRERKFVPVSREDVKLDGRFSGYASVFDAVDQGGDVVAPGAFAASLSGRPASDVKMLFQHDPDQPIGVWTRIEEDARGLHVEGRITRSTAKGAEVLELMRDGALDGLSIGFRTKKASKDAGSGVRRILEADLWEISVVTFPLLMAARIDTVKHAQGVGEPPSLRELERWLTHDAGLSRSQARVVLAAGYGALSRKQDATGRETLADTIRRATRSFHPGV